VQLASGIYLAAGFPKTPFDAAFMDRMNAVAAKHTIKVETAQ